MYPSLDLAVLQVLQNNAPVNFGFDSGGQDMGHLEDIIVGNAVIPVDDQMSALVPYRGGFRSFPYVSATDVIKGVADPAALKDAVVYVGTSAPGLQDLRTTPVGSVYPGVEVHANFLSGVLDGRVMNAHPQYLRGAQSAAVAAHIRAHHLGGHVQVRDHRRLGRCSAPPSWCCRRFRPVEIRHRWCSHWLRR